MIPSVIQSEIICLGSTPMVVLQGMLIPVQFVILCNNLHKEQFRDVGDVCDLDTELSTSGCMDLKDL